VSSNIGSGSHTASYPMRTEGCFLAGKAPGHKTDHSPQTTAEVNNTRVYTPTPSDVFMADNDILYKYDVFEHYPSSCLYIKHRPLYITKYIVSESAFCLRLHVKPIQLGPIDRTDPQSLDPSSSIDWAQLNKFYLKRRQSSLRNVFEK
jgi:hypothetical protein